MICQRCYCDNSSDASFCAKCGGDLREPGQAAPPPIPPGPPPPQGGQYGGYQPNQQPPYQQPPYQQPYQQPPYQPGYQQGVPQGQYQGYMPPGAQPQSVSNHMVEAILTTLFCFLPLGIAAIVFASQVNNHLKVGNIPAAMESSRKAKLYASISFFIGIGILIIYAIALATTYPYFFR